LLPAALLQLADVLVERSKYAEATAYLDRAEALLRSRSGVPTLEQAAVRAVRANLQMALGGIEAAHPLYLEAIQLAEASGGKSSGELVAIRMRFARNLILSGIGKEGKAQLDEALHQLRRGGGQNDIAAALAESYSTVDLYSWEFISPEETEATLTRNRNVLLSHGESVPPLLRARLDFDSAQFYLDWGDVGSAHEHMARALPILRAVSETPYSKQVLFGLAGDIAAASGHHDEATTLLEDSRQMRKITTNDNPYEVMKSTLALAANFRMQGRLSQARAELDRISLSEPKTSRERDTHKIIIAEASLLALDQGLPRQAFELLQKEGDAEEVVVQNYLDGVRGRALCELGRTTEGLALLENQLARESSRRFKRSPEMAKLRSVLGICALHSGKRQHAEEMAGLARAAFDRQSEVSNYYKVQLTRLESMLSLGRDRQGTKP
jgi:tetratricopeptide (TPR) repeat protein